jgi:hypothetical protein
MTKFEQKSFSVPVTAHDYDPNPKPEPPCPCCPLPAGLEPGHARIWKLCARHRDELPSE